MTTPRHGRKHGPKVAAIARRGTGSMVYLNWTNISQRSMIVSSWLLQVAAGASIILHVRMDMSWMVRYSGVIESCARQDSHTLTVLENC